MKMKMRRIEIENQWNARGDLINKYSNIFFPLVSKVEVTLLPFCILTPKANQQIELAFVAFI